MVRKSLAYLAKVVPARSGEGVAVELPSPLPLRREEAGGVVRWTPPPPLHLEGETAHRFLDRTLVGANAWGLGATRVDRALRALDAAGGPDALLRTIGREKAGIFPAWLASNTNAGSLDPKGAWRRFLGTFRGERIAGTELPGPRRSLPRETALALEMALHEERERRALQGELAALEAAWREAEEIAEIAAIADTLPEDPLDRLRGA